MDVCGPHISAIKAYMNGPARDTHLLSSDRLPQNNLKSQLLKNSSGKGITAPECSYFSRRYTSCHVYTCPLCYFGISVSLFLCLDNQT